MAKKRGTTRLTAVVFVAVVVVVVVVVFVFVFVVVVVVDVVFVVVVVVLAIKSDCCNALALAQNWAGCCKNSLSSGNVHLILH